MTSKTLTNFENRINQVQPSLATSFGKSLIVAPHPDDETLGCGGTAALLLGKGIDVHFLFVSDGTMSHPNSKKYPPHKLRMLREDEARDAVRLLGGMESNVTFLAMPDRKVPDQQSLYFEATVRLFMNIFTHYEPETIFIPWQNDPHPDHKATYQIVSAAVSRGLSQPNVLQYPIWFWEMRSDRDIELIEKMQLVRVDISEVLEIKLSALHAHKSQLTNLIDDDPEGFRLTPEVIAHFDHPWEIFFRT